MGKMDRGRFLVLDWVQLVDINLGSDLWISFMPDFKLFGFDLDWLEMRLIWVVFVVEVSSQRDMVSLCSTIFEEQVLEISITFIEWKSSFLEIWEDTSGLVGKNMGEKKAAGLVPKRRIKIPHFDNSALIAGYSKTLFGRCMNPRKQEMKTLLFMLPRIWQIEGKVVGADLGLGRFQFDFESEDDIEAVLKMEPLHFDHWMVSLVRWSPSVDPNYPSAITFWIRVLGVPIELWADPTFRFIGEDLGVVKEVDIHGGRVQVTVDGFKPLCFETEVEFGNSAETTMFLQYERLYGFCKRCHSLCHEEALCGFSAVPCFVYVNQTEEVDEGRHLQSYKGAAAQVGNQNGGASSSRRRQFENYYQYNDYRFSKAGGKGGKGKQSECKEKAAMEIPEKQADLIEESQPKQVRKALFSSLESMDLAAVGLEVEPSCGKVDSLEEGELIADHETALHGETIAGVNGAEKIGMTVEDVDGDDLLEICPSLLVSVKTDNIDETMEIHVAESEVLEEADTEMMSSKEDAEEVSVVRDSDLEPARKLKGNGVLMGVSSKKRNLLSSPRRRVLAKGGEQAGEGVNPTHQGMVKGSLGGNKPPKPKVIK
ncbi:unnamed protein product [Arabidopsis thaliana]|uniref:(thale cress) hypothetical protein n=1 Tax=Arabidopsis thaliana TaxID=3702 RepID=A0A7G2E5E2_ARATH|nr:unnamed protein product [Arabidopsis thaliana]